jgi:SpoVK/Ycf46/Vps4 family AAA+-type ATPase
MSEKIDWDKLVELTKGCSGADICNICRDAAYMPMRRKLAQVGGIMKIS